MGGPGDDAGEERRREALLGGIFSVLDQKRRGFISRVELAHILDAMQADSSVTFVVPDALVPTENMKDSRVTMSDLRKFLAGLGVPDLEDVQWFAESVVKVETELREVWRKSVQRWRERVERLYNRNLHRYLLVSQPERVSRWLLLRTSMDDVGHDDSSTGLLGLGISQQEVEVLFTDETSDDINRCGDKIEPFLSALDIRGQLLEACLEGDAEERSTPELDARICALLTSLVELADRQRELACLLIHEDTLSFATAVVRSGAFSHSVVVECSKLIMSLVNYRVHEQARDYEKLCRQRVADFLEIDFQVDEFNLDKERQKLSSAAAPPGRASLVPLSDEHDVEALTIADWVGSLLTLRVDFDRGEMLDVLIKFDEQRLPAADGSQASGGEPVAASLFSWGRTVIYILCRLDLASHHCLHEHRTPMRTHLWKLLLNVLSSAGERGRRLFRIGEGTRVLCAAVRGNAWGIERDEVTPDEEEDREEEDDLYRPSQPTWSLRDPQNSWPHVECFEDGRREYRYYAMDFLDDKFYGSKDRILAAAFLEYMSSDTVWGEEAVVEEMLQYENTLQNLCRVRPACVHLVRLQLNAPGFPQYLRAVARRIAMATAEVTVGALCEPDATCHSLFPLSYDAERRERREALSHFREMWIAVETKNVALRILAHAYHTLQACLQEERILRESKKKAARNSALGPSSDEPEDEETQLEEGITECCRLLATRVPLQVEDVNDMAVTVFMQVKRFTRKALLAVNALPSVHPDGRQKAQGVENAWTVPPKPMFFGHYQQLINNQSNPVQPSSRPLVAGHEIRLKCLQGTAEIFFTGESRYLSDPSLYPYEFLVVLRILQLIRLRERGLVSPFLAELQDTLEQLTGQRSSFVFSDTREDAELAGVEYSWRTGLAQLTTFRVAQVPLRRAELRRFPRRCPLDVLDGLDAILREYQALDLWEEARDDIPPGYGRDVAQLEALAVRRSVLLALVFNHLCYFHPKMVTLEDSPHGLSLRLGVSFEGIARVRALLAEPILADLRSGMEFTSVEMLAGVECQAFQGSPAGAVVALLVPSGETSRMAFVCMAGIWMLWSNCTKDASHVLTECGHVLKHFSFDAGPRD